MSLAYETLRFVEGSIIIDGRLFSPDGMQMDLRLALDTGTPNTVIDERIAIRAGYGPESAIRGVTFTTLTGIEKGYMLPVTRFSALGRTLENYELTCQPFRPDIGLDGLLGLDFFQGAELRLELIPSRVTLAWV